MAESLAPSSTSTALADPQHREAVAALAKLIYERYGYDFREYSAESLAKRLDRSLSKFECHDLAKLHHRVASDPDFFTHLLSELTITVTEMFRDPLLYQLVRTELVPYLRTFPEIKVWHAGCSSGEELYSMAILLEEEGLYHRSLFYGTDINPQALRKAREGILSIDAVRQATKNYYAAGGTRPFNEYYLAKYEAALIDTSLKARVLFSRHNLVSDGCFGEMPLIFCRNVLIYFNRPLQERVLALLTESLAPGGFLCLGARDAVSMLDGMRNLSVYHRGMRIYRKRR